VSEGDQAVLVTGANGDIGKSLCKLLGDAGYYVIATDTGRQAGGCRCDVFVGADLEQLVLDESFINDFRDSVADGISGRKLKGLVNNAAVQKLSGLDGIELTDFRTSLDVNVTAPMLLVKLFLNDLEAAQGSVVNIGSIHAKLTKPAFISYATSKTALEGLTRALAVDLGGRVRVNAIQPAAVETAMLLNGFGGHDDKYPALKACHPVNRISRPAEIAEVTIFMLSDNCRFMTGSIVSVDGGIGSRLHDPE
jgi:NAD(P)-dependent dehydrogenase (short-subunit alcohol dehydrogenase family)